MRPCCPSHQVLAHIQSFVDQFKLPLDELVEPDLTKYKARYELPLLEITSLADELINLRRLPA